MTLDGVVTDATVHVSATTVSPRRQRHRRAAAHQPGASTARTRRARRRAIDVAGATPDLKYRMDSGESAALATTTPVRSSPHTCGAESGIVVNNDSGGGAAVARCAHTWALRFWYRGELVEIGGDHSPRSWPNRGAGSSKSARRTAPRLLADYERALEPETALVLNCTRRTPHGRLRRVHPLSELRCPRRAGDGRRRIGSPRRHHPVARAPAIVAPRRTGRSPGDRRHDARDVLGRQAARRAASGSHRGTAAAVATITRHPLAHRDARRQAHGRAAPVRGVGISPGDAQRDSVWQMATRTVDDLRLRAEEHGRGPCRRRS